MTTIKKIAETKRLEFPSAFSFQPLKIKQEFESKAY
jgi:hypothetical protein